MSKSEKIRKCIALTIITFAMDALYDESTSPWKEKNIKRALDENTQKEGRRGRELFQENYGPRDL